MPSTPPIKQIPEAERDLDLSFDNASKGKVPAPVAVGEEAFRDGKTDDGSQDSDDALSHT